MYRQRITSQQYLHMKKRFLYKKIVRIIYTKYILYNACEKHIQTSNAQLQRLNQTESICRLFKESDTRPK